MQKTLYNQYEYEKAVSSEFENEEGAAFFLISGTGYTRFQTLYSKEKQGKREILHGKLHKNGNMN